MVIIAEQSVFHEYRKEQGNNGRSMRPMLSILPYRKRTLLLDGYCEL
jgi:hypothetical protein